MTKRCTYDPEQPPLHLEDRNHVACVQYHVRDEEDREPERRVEVGAHHTERPEEALHRQECHVDLTAPAINNLRDAEA